MAGGALPIDVSVSAPGIRALGDALRAEEDGKALRKELAKNMREALKPAAERAKSGIMSMPSSGRSHPGPALRASIAKKIRPEVKLGGRWTGASVKAKKIPGMRSFPNAPKRTQNPNGWRSPVFGDREVWVQHHGKPKWFDRATANVGPDAKAAVLAAMDDMARRVASRAH